MNTGDNDAAFYYTEAAKDAIILERNVKDHPASSIARLFLLGHYKINNDPAFTQFAKQTSLYFNNPYWLQLQLSRIELYKEAAISSDPHLPAKTEDTAATVAGDEKDDGNELKEEPVILPSTDEYTGSKDTAEIRGGAEHEEEHLLVLKDENPGRLLPGDDEATSASPKEEDELAFEPKEIFRAVNVEAGTSHDNRTSVNEEEVMPPD